MLDVGVLISRVSGKLGPYDYNLFNVRKKLWGARAVRPPCVRYVTVMRLF